MFSKEMLNEFSKYRKEYEFIPDRTKIPLMVPSFGNEEILEALDSLVSTNVTMGEKVKKFEKMFAEYLDVEHCVMFNSGSSANLVALSILSNPYMKEIVPSDEVITPSVTWATTVYPICNVNAVPVFVDVDLDFCIDVNQIEKAISTRTRAIMPVHLLGNPCAMDKIMDVANRYDLVVIEDACEAHGAELQNKKVGAFGDMGTFSFFLSHHITTIEGGMIVTNDERYFELAKSMRAFGWVRDLNDVQRWAAEYDHIDHRFLFVNLGYNLRPTEIQGSFGIHQLGKLDRFIDIRRNNAGFWTRKLSAYRDLFILPDEKPNCRQVYFGYPLTIKKEAPFSRKQIVAYLEDKKIETRPIMAGNIVEQPVMRLLKHRVAGSLHNSELIMRNSFFFGNHQGIGEQEREYVAECIETFIAETTSR